VAERIEHLANGALDRVLMDGVGLGVIVLDPNLRVEKWNDWLSLETRTPPDQAVGREICELYPCLQERGLDDKMREVMAQGCAQLLSPFFHRYFIPIQIISTDILMVQYTRLLPIKHDDAVVGLMVLIEDYTERMFFETELKRKNEELVEERLQLHQTLTDLKRAHEALRSAQEELMEAERMKIVVEMAGAAAHEINQPLMALMGYSERLLMRGMPTECDREIVTQIYKSSERIGEIVGKMRTIRKYETKPYAFGNSIVDLGMSSEEEQA